MATISLHSFWSWHVNTHLLLYLVSLAVLLLFQALYMRGRIVFFLLKGRKSSLSLGVISNCTFQSVVQVGVLSSRTTVKQEENTQLSIILGVFINSKWSLNCISNVDVCVIAGVSIQPSLTHSYSRPQCCQEDQSPFSRIDSDPNAPQMSWEVSVQTLWCRPIVDAHWTCILFRDIRLLL